MSTFYCEIDILLVEFLRINGNYCVMKETIPSYAKMILLEVECLCVVDNMLDRDNSLVIRP